jgi:hypothetical protein
MMTDQLNRIERAVGDLTGTVRTYIESTEKRLDGHDQRFVSLEDAQSKHAQKDAHRAGWVAGGAFVASIFGVTVARKLGLL